MIKSILTEYGIGWVVNRLLYSAKLKMMTKIPATEHLFESNVEVKRVDIFNLDVDRIKDFLIALPAEKKHDIVAIADNALNGIITGFSSIEMDYGNPINWHYSPITKQEASRSVKWYRIPDFDAKRGDIKAIWEASRFTHFFYFTRAYLITGDEKYYIAFSEQLKQWLTDNPYPYGANYKCGQECTLRMINALMAYKVFEQLTTGDDEKNVCRLVEVCYKKVLSNFFYAHKCIKNNHTLSEICGLIIGAWCCGDKQRLSKAYKLLNKEIESQFMPDGGYIQYSFNYQRFVLQIIECVFKISEKTGMSISDKSKNLIKNSALLMYQCQDEIGDVPNYGSNDGALIFPVTVCGYRDFTPVINTAYALVTGERLFKKGYYDEELIWFSDADSLPVVRIEKKSIAFYDAGLYTLRHNNGFLMICLQDFKTRPAHMDGMHLDLWHKGKNILCDSGTYSYANEIGKNLAKTAAHNTVKVQGVEQMGSYSNFMIYNWTSRVDVDFTEDNFISTMISKNGYKHTRRIVQTERGYEIADEVIGNGDSCSFLFHTPYEVKLAPGGFKVFDEGEKLCVVKFDSVNVEVCKAYRSLYYLKKEEINCIVVKCSLSDKCNFKFEIKLNK
ncbi:MAG: heparinase II/III family protein [Negativicutes bacterium]|nr:heparinase II/III family protein [Negativicutes bacterium]